VTRRVRILRRKPRSRRDRVVVRLHAVRDDTSRRWKRLRRPRRRDSARLRAQELFVQLAEKVHLEPEPSARARPGRPHIRRNQR